MPYRLTPSFHKVVDSILGSGKSGRSLVKWTAFKKLFEKQFQHSVDVRDNDLHKFTPRQDTPPNVWPWDTKPFLVHKPSSATFTPQELDNLRSTFRTSYSWDSHTFEVTPPPITKPTSNGQPKDAKPTTEGQPEVAKLAAEEPRK